MVFLGNDLFWILYNCYIVILDDNNNSNNNNMLISMILWQYWPIKCKRHKKKSTTSTITAAYNHVWMYYIKLSSDLEGGRRWHDVILTLSGQRTALLLQSKAAIYSLHNYNPFYVRQYCDAFLIYTLINTKYEKK